MEIKISSPKPGVSSSDCVSDPEEKEISEDDDDDRNHKHRRRDTRSQSLETDSLETVFNRPYRKRNKPFENGHPYRDGDSQSNETWKSYNSAVLEKDFSTRFEKRRGVASFSRAAFDSNPRMRGIQSLSGDPVSGRGRGREPGSWAQRDSRYNTVDIASQLVQQGSVPPGMFPGRGIQNVSNPQSAAWNTFGLVPGMPNGGLDTLHSLGLQGALRTHMNSTMSIGVPRQRCRDFEERGFCLRGDMCPMEHGVNRIVVEDVQSLSQFNLPVSLPSGPLLGTPGGQGPLPTTSAPPCTLINSKALLSKNTKLGVTDDVFGLNGAFNSPVAGATDLYDPDQPLWTNNHPESSALLAMNPSNLDDNESLLDADTSDHNQVGLCDGFDNERPIRDTGAQSSSVWGRIGGLKNKLETHEKIDSTINSATYLGKEVRKDMESQSTSHGAFVQGRRMNVDSIGLQASELSLRSQVDLGRTVRKHSQKALRTLFVSGIPAKDNKREALLAHFRKFGEVIDIYIPLNSDRAFVQFSKREEAEAAIKAPDAVMGNRFIRLRWANRDNTPDDGNSGGSNASVTPQGMVPASLAPHPPVPSKVKDSPLSAGPKGSIIHPSVAATSSSDHSKPVVANGPRAPPPLQKKLENLELLKEELRKKQEMLDQKRDEFRRQLFKLEKQATGVKDEVAADQAVKRQKGGSMTESAKAEISKTADSSVVVSSPQTEVAPNSSRSVDNIVTQIPKPCSTAVTLESPSLKQSIRPLAPHGAPFIIHRYKLDNRPTTFKIIPPLPSGLADVAVLKEHFSVYGDLSTVELEDLDSQGGDDGLEASKISARISFMTRRSAERAFLDAKCWQGHNLQFMWLASSKSSKDISVKENPSVICTSLSDVNAQSAGETSTCSRIADASENGESGMLGKRESDTGCVDLDEEPKSNSPARSCEKQSA